MSDTVHSAAEIEAPVNPYSLLEAVNASSETAHSSWLIFLGLMSYMLVAIAGVSHVDLLLNNHIALPIVQVKISLKHFFMFAPIVLVLIHLGVITQLVMLARKAIEFDKAMRLLEVNNNRRHPLRLELHNFFFVQAIAGPQRSKVMGTFLHAMTWLTLAILPVLLMLFIQVMFLPYHNVAITWGHRIALVADSTILILIGVFLVRGDTSFFKAFYRTALRNPISFLLTTIVLGSVSFFSFFIATVPGERLDFVGERLLRAAAGEGAGAIADRKAGFIPIPFFGGTIDGALFGLFYRNLVVTDVDLVKDKTVTANEPTLNLRGRDLRYARLDRSDMHQADFTGANLNGASLKQTDLRGAFLRCVKDVRLEEREAAKCTNARGADFTRVNLENATLVGMDLTGAIFDEARLTAADMSVTVMSGVDFSNAHMERTLLSDGAHMEGANFLQTHMQGADLSGAILMGANLGNAFLQGANLEWANLDGADLSEANLDGADLSKSSLRGAKMSNTRLRGANLREATVWSTTPPNAEDTTLADFSLLNLTSPGAVARDSMLVNLAEIKDKAIRARVRDRLAGIMNQQAADLWARDQEKILWDNLVAQRVGTTPGLVDYRGLVTNYLGDLMCNNPWQGGGVATGVLRQATKQSDDFRADGAALYARLKSGNCTGGTGVPQKLINQLETSLAAARLQ